MFAFIFEKDLNHQNHSSSGSLDPVKEFPPISDLSTPYHYLENLGCWTHQVLNSIYYIQGP